MAAKPPAGEYRHHWGQDAGAAQRYPNAIEHGYLEENELARVRKLVARPDSKPKTEGDDDEQV
jgi:hypothetical protein